MVINHLLTGMILQVLHIYLHFPLTVAIFLLDNPYIWRIWVMNKHSKLDAHFSTNITIDFRLKFDPTKMDTVIEWSLFFEDSLTSTTKLFTWTTWNKLLIMTWRYMKHENLHWFMMGSLEWLMYMSGDSWMYPLPTYPYGKSLYKPYIVGVYGLLSPRIPI